MVVFPCTCGRQLQAREDFAGQIVRCPECGRAQSVPSSSETSSEPPEESEDRGQRDQRGSRSGRPRYYESGDGHRPRYRDGYGHDDFPPLRQESVTSGKAIVALILGFASFFGSLLFSVPAVVLGAWSLRDIRRSQGALGGKAMAVCGLILGIVGAFCLPIGGLGIWLATAEVRERATSEENLEEIGSAMLSYQTNHGSLPAAAIQKGDQPLLSWRVAILPYLGETALYSQFHLDEPWDSPANKALLPQMPEVYVARAKSETRPGYTFYRVFHKPTENPPNARDPWGFNNQQTVGPMFVGNTGIPSWNIPDGPGQTLLVVEAAQSVPWTKPDELAYPVVGSVESQLGGAFKNGYHVLLADCCTVRFFTKGQIADSTLRGAITRNGSEIIMLPYW